MSPNQQRMINRIIGIAINEYDDPFLNNLHNCVNDLNEIVGVLSTRYQFDEFEIISRKEQTTHKFLFNRLYNELVNSLKSENIVIIFAGHGQFNPYLKTSYWLPSDASHDDLSTWFDLDHLIKFMWAANASHISLISDSCFSGGIIDSSLRGGGVQALESKKSRVALTSGGIEIVSDGPRGDLSPFTKALVHVLSANTENQLPFSFFAEKVIRHFDGNRVQTPSFSPLLNAGHKGGAFLLRLKEDSSSRFSDISLPLDLKLPLNIQYSCTIPFFHESATFNSGFVNAYVQQLAFSAISDARIFLQNYKELLITSTSGSLGISYTVDQLNDKFLSLTITIDDYFGGPHPNYYIYSLNFAFNPDRKLSLYDLIDYGGTTNFKTFLESMIERFAHEEHKEHLLPHLDHIDPHHLGFSFNEKTLTVYFVNHLPHVIKAAGFLEIPVDQLKLRI